MADDRRSSLARFLSPAQMRRSFVRQVSQVLRADIWFPHVPLALAVGFMGAMFLLGAGSTGFSLTALLDLSAESLSGHEVAIPSLVIGIAMLTMSVGLLLRSRFSWGIALLLTAVTLVVAFQFRFSVFSILAWFDAVTLIALIFARRSFHRSSLAAGSLFALMSVTLLLMYSIFGALYLRADFSQPIDNIATALYYAIITMSTVGYGDFAPLTIRARLFAVSITILGITIFATSISAVVVPMISGSLNRIMHPKGKRMKRKDHYVIVGNTPLAANTYRELRSRNQPVTVIVAVAQATTEYADADVVVGDPTSLDVLREAGADQARAVLAMRGDDSENAFIVLAVKELECSAKTVAAVNDSRLVSRVKRVHPDILIAPQVLGGELLAMALSGESITGDFVMDRFLNFEAKK